MEPDTVEGSLGHLQSRCGFGKSGRSAVFPIFSYNLMTYIDEFSGEPPSGREPPSIPSFTLETATQKVLMAEDPWNTRDPERVAFAYTTDSRWPKRAEFLQGRAEIEAFLTPKWQHELDYWLIK